MTVSVQEHEKIPAGGLLDVLFKILLAVLLVFLVGATTYPAMSSQRRDSYDATQNISQLERTYGVKLTEEQAYQIGVPSDSFESKGYQGLTRGITVTLNGDEVYLYGVVKGKEFQLWSCSLSPCQGKELPRLQ